MPLKHKNTKRKKIIIFAIILALAVLMIISFGTDPHITETVLIPAAP